MEVTVVHSRDTVVKTVVNASRLSGSVAEHGRQEDQGSQHAGSLSNHLKVDYETDARELDRRVAEMAAVLKKLDGVRVERHVPEIANEAPHLAVEWDEAARSLTAQQVHDRLRDGDPPIWVLHRGKGKLLVSVCLCRRR